jgi:WD40 repeat protein/serine/threonine protein kinase
MTEPSSDRDVLLNRLAEDFAARYRQGERPALREYLEQYPELADDIRDLFPALAEMEQIKEDASAIESPAASPALEQLGDFRVLREIGHGGMGVVYEAEQVSLGRHVALKVLPQRVLRDAKTKRRFEREAKSAAKLHHTNIVPVFGVGEHEGLPYYVMQFIQGLGLDQVIEELRRMTPEGIARHPSIPVDSQGRLGNLRRKDITAADMARSLVTGEFRPVAADVTGANETSQRATTPPTPTSTGLLSNSSFPSSSSVVLPGRSDSSDESSSRKASYWQSVAQIGVQVANALEYAHKQGVLHRDIKPSNLLLDTHGTVWVTDFGLAKADDQDNLTQTGDLLGTLRYMSPEAFEGKSDVRSDVYSLGLTLYELLTFRPAFEERNRHRLIKQVTDTGPAPRDRLNRAIPRDLATIVHKAMDREPGRRYATANELAADLHRFLDDEPIQARRASAAERLLRWARHHPGVALSLATIGMLLVTLTAGSFFAAARFQEQARLQKQLAQDKDSERNKAVEARNEAQQNLYYAEMNLARQAAELPSGIGRMNQLLAKWRSTDLPTDPRGWEWYYLYGLSQRDRFTIRAHAGTVRCVRWSPDDKRLASCGDDGTVRLWDAATGQEILTFKGHEGRVDAVAWTRDGNKLASASYDNTVKLWDLGTGQQTRTLSGYNHPISTVAWSPDQTRVALGGESGRAMVFDAASGRSLWLSRSRHGYWLQSLDWSADGRRIVSCGYDGQIRFWNAADGEELGTQPDASISAGSAFASAVAWSPDGRWLVSGSADRTIRLLDGTTGQMVRWLRGHANSVHGIAWHPSCRWIASASADGTVKRWEFASGKEIATLRGHAGAVEAVSFSPNGERLVSAGEDGTIKIWNTVDDHNTLTLECAQGRVWWVSWRPDGRRLATAGNDGTVRVWDAATGQVIHVLHGHKTRVNSVAWSPDGQRLASTSDDHRNIIWDAATGKALRDWNAHSTIGNTVAWSPDGSRLASSSHDNSAKVWDPETGKLLNTVRHPELVHSVCWSPDGRRLLTGSWDRTLRIWDAAGGKELLQMRGHSQYVEAVSWSPDGNSIASSSTDRTVRVWAAQDGLLLRTLIGHSSRVLSVAWSPDGSRLASGGDDGTIKVWDSATGQEILTLREHKDSVSGVSWSADGSRLATSSEDGTVKIWDATPGYAAEKRKSPAWEPAPK